MKHNVRVTRDSSAIFSQSVTVIVDNTQRMACECSCVWELNEMSQNLNITLTFFLYMNTYVVKVLDWYT